MERDDKLGAEGGAELDADLLVNVARDAEVDQVQLARLWDLEMSIRGQYSGHVTTLSQLEASIQVTFQVLTNQ